MCAIVTAMFQRESKASRMRKKGRAMNSLARVSKGWSKVVVAVGFAVLGTARAGNVDPTDREQRQAPVKPPKKLIQRMDAATYKPSNLSEDLRPARVKEENYGFDRTGLIGVDEFSGALSSSIRELSLPGNGGMSIDVYRRYESARVVAAAWDDQFMYGVSVKKYFPAETGAFGPYPGWSITAAPTVSISVGHQPHPDFAKHMTDGLDKLCTGEPFRADNNGTSGRYGTTILYTMTLPDGRQEVLVPTSTGVVQSRSGWKMTCIGGTGGTHYLNSPDGNRYILGKKYNNWNTEVVDSLDWTVLVVAATRQEDVNGNWIQFDYTDVLERGAQRPRLSRVTSSDGRELNFSYVQSPLLHEGQPYYRLDRVSTGYGSSWTYGYDSEGRLSSVSDPVSRTWMYEYHPRPAFNVNTGLIQGLANHAQPDWAKGNHLSKISVPTGGSYTIDYAPSEVRGRGTWAYEGLAAEMQEDASNNWYTMGDEALLVRANWTIRVSSIANSNGDSWAYQYAPARSQGAYDVTTVSTPAGVIAHKFIGEGFFVPTANWSSNPLVFDYVGAFKPNAWMVGLPVEKSWGSDRVEKYEWTPRTHSSIYYSAYSGFVGLRDEVTYAAVPSKITILQGGASYVTTLSNYDSFGNPGLKVEVGPNGGNRSTVLSYLNDTTQWIIGRPKDESFTGGSIARSFDAKGRVLSYSKDGVATNYTYDAQGNIATKTEPRGLVYTYSNYKRGIPQSESQPEGVTLTRVVDEAGNVTSETSGSGKTTQYSFDGIGRVTSIIYPKGFPRTNTYSTNSRTSTRGETVELDVFDAFGRPASQVRGGIVTWFVHDALGRRTFVSHPGASSGTHVAYDLLGRVTRVTRADSSYQVHTYGPATKSETDEAGKTTTYAFRSYGDPSQQFLMGIVAPESSANMSFTRNARDLVSTVSQGGMIRTYGYNANYFLTSVVNPETGTTVYGRDAAGNMTSLKVGSSGTTHFGYDGRNRLSSVTYPVGTPNVTRTYTKDDRLETVSSNVASLSYSYDGNGNLTTESMVIDGIRFTTGYSFNDNDRLKSLTYPISGRTVDYAPDEMGRPTKAGAYVSGVLFWPSGQLKQLNYANGVVTNYGQDVRQWPSSLGVSRNGTVYVASKYSYGSQGNLSSIVDSVDPGLNRTLGYDGIDRLISVAGPWGSGSIEYDGAGNIKSQYYGSWSLIYNYDSANRLNSVSGSRAGNLGYDAYGNVTAAFGSTSTYNAASSLVCVDCAVPSRKVEYGYDGLNRRASVLKAGIKRYEVYDSSGNLIVEYAPSLANRLTEYIYIGSKRVAQRVTP